MGGVIGVCGADCVEAPERGGCPGGVCDVCWAGPSCVHVVCVVG